MDSLKTTMQKRIQRQLSELQDRITKDVSVFAQNEQTDIEKRYTEAAQGNEEFGRIYAPHYFDLPSAQYHKDLDAMTDWGDRHLFVVHGPREHGKTIRLRIAKLRLILTAKKHFLAKVSETLGLAKDDISFLMLEFQFNERIKSDFIIDFLKSEEGELRMRVIPRATGKAHYCMIKAYSYGTSMRGATFMKYRPDFCDIDDFENKRTARNPRIAREKIEWVLTELFLAVSSAAPILWVGNNTARTSALNQMFLTECKNFRTDPKTGKKIIPDEPDAPPKWKKHTITGHIYKALRQVKGKPFALWPEKMTCNALLKLKETIGTHRFECDIQGNPVEELLYFKHEWINTYDELPPLKRCIAWIDQSLGQTKNNDYKAIVVAGTDYKAYYLIAAWLRQSTLRAMVEAAYSLFIQLQPLGLTVFKIEDNFGQYSQVSYKEFIDASKRFGFPLPVSPIRNTLKKEMRIESLAPLMETKKIFWPVNPDQDMEELKEQILGFPDHPFDDGPDALAGVVEELRRFSVEQGAFYRSLGKRRYDKRGR